MDGGEDYFCILIRKPIEVCRIARSKRCSMGKKDLAAPGVGLLHHKACIIMGINSMQSVVK